MPILIGICYNEKKENKTMRYHAVIFDLDGTLLNTLEDLTDGVNHVLAQFGYPVRTQAEIKRFVGNGIRQLIRLALPNGESNPDFAKVFSAFSEYYTAHCNLKTGPYEGILPMLSRLQECGVRLAIVSNKNHAAVNRLCSIYFQNFISVAIGENEPMGIRKKPAPDSVFAAIQALQVPASDCLYVGDSEVDVQTAKNANLDCASVLWGFRSRSELLAAGADKLFNNPSELTEFVLKTDILNV